MKTIVATLMLCAAPLMAQDYFYIYSSQSQRGDMPADVKGVNLQDRTGDVRDYAKTGLPRLPANTLIDRRTGYSIATTNIMDGISNLLARAQALAYDASTNYLAAATKVRGGGRSIKDLRKSDKKLKSEEIFEAILSRMEMQEALLDQRGIMTPGKALREDQ